MPHSGFCFPFLLLSCRGFFPFQAFASHRTLIQKPFFSSLYMPFDLVPSMPAATASLAGCPKGPLTWAPAASSSCTHCAWPCRLAACRGVMESTMTWLTQAPFSISCCSCRASPRWAASCTGVRSTQKPGKAMDLVMRPCHFYEGQMNTLTTPETP